MENNFLRDVVEEPIKRGQLLDLVLTKKEGLIEGVRVGDSLDSSYMRQWSLWYSRTKEGKK